MAHWLVQEGAIQEASYEKGKGKKHLGRINEKTGISFQKRSDIFNI